MKERHAQRSPGAANGDPLVGIAQVQAPALVPEIRFAGLPAGETLERFRTRNAAVIGMATPYWAVAWPGGQALARYILDTPGLVRGRRVLDLGCGAGLVAVAACMAGASEVTAVDSDAMAVRATAVSAMLNTVRLRAVQGDFTRIDGTADIVCAGDLWYDRTTGRQATSTLARLGGCGRLLLVGDALRPGRPRAGIVELARYRLEVPDEFGMPGQTFATASRFDPEP